MFRCTHFDHRLELGGYRVLLQAFPLCGSTGETTRHWSARQGQKPIAVAASSKVCCPSVADQAWRDAQLHAEHETVGTLKETLVGYAEVICGKSTFQGNRDAGLVDAGLGHSN